LAPAVGESSLGAGAKRSDQCPVDIGGYSAGAAHPNSYTDVINFDLHNGKQLKLADLFKPGAKYLTVLSAYCVQDLKNSRSKRRRRMLDVDWIQRGAGPRCEQLPQLDHHQKSLGVNLIPIRLAHTPQVRSMSWCLTRP